MNASCFVYEWACVAMCCSVLQCRCPRFTVSNNAEIGTYSPLYPWELKYVSERVCDIPNGAVEFKMCILMKTDGQN